MDTETSGFGAWGWIILIFLFFLGFSGGNGLFGNGGNSTSAATIYAQQAATTANENSKAVIAQGYEAQLATMDSSYKTLLGFKDSQYQMAQCCLTKFKATVRKILRWFKKPDIRLIAGNTLALA